MSWLDRIREAAYTSPGGIRTTLIYEDVSVSVDKKTSAFEFPDVDGTFVQDLGKTGRRLPLRVFFTGPDYDLDSQRFFDALAEQGVGRLEHPVYGVLDVVPTGSINRRDDLKTAANQAVIEVTFFETIGAVFPTAQLDPASQVEQAVVEYNVTAAEQFAEQADLSTAVKRSVFASGYTSVLMQVRAALLPIVAATVSVQKQFNAISDSIETGLADLLDDPESLAAQSAALTQVAGTSSLPILARLDQYRAVINKIISRARTTSITDFFGLEMFTVAASIGQIISVMNTEFSTKPEAILAAESLLETFGKVSSWRDDNFEFFGAIDTGESYQKYQEAIAVAAGFLVELSFTLQQERTITLDRARTIIDLSAEIYGEVDSRLDFLISSNDLTGDEILELPAGREVKYYV